MAKKGFLALIIAAIILLSIGGYFLFFGESVTVYTDGENVTVTSVVSPFSGVDTDKMNEEICQYTYDEMNSTDGDVTSLIQGIRRICLSYGIDNVNVKFNSSLGENKIPIVFHIKGNSMSPTLEDGQTVVVEKTKNIQLNSIVVAYSPEYGVIIKRVSQIKGDEVYLVSDNKEIIYEDINGTTYKTQGISVWVNIDDIYGVVVEY